MKEAEYTKTLRRHNLTVADISKMFGAKSEHNYRCSTQFKQRMKGICELIERIEDNIIKNIKE